MLWILLTLRGRCCLEKVKAQSGMLVDAGDRYDRAILLTQRTNYGREVMGRILFDRNDEDYPWDGYISTEFERNVFVSNREKVPCHL